jgi:DNA polymerase III alpha subunit (gram-positive type)
MILLLITMNGKNMNLIIFDCETGGLDFNKNPITEIALVAVDPVKFKPIHKFESFVQPYQDLEITQKSLEHSRVSLADIKNGMEAEKLIRELIKFFKASTVRGFQGKPVLCGHNVSFDIAFLSSLFARYGKNLADYVAENNGEIDRMDTMRLARLKWRKVDKSNDKFNLGACCKRAGIDLVGAHGAMNDTLVTVKLLAYFSDSMQGDGKVESREELEQQKTRRFFEI